MYLHMIGSSWLEHPFLRSSFLLEHEKDLNRILESGIQTVWIDESRGLSIDDVEDEQEQDVDAHGISAADDAAEGLSEDERVAIEQDRMPSQVRTGYAQMRTRHVPLTVEINRARQICQAGKQQVMAMFEEVRLGNSVDSAAVLPLVEEMNASVLRNPVALLSVARLKTHDDYTYLHSVAVAALMLALSRQLGLDPGLTKRAGCGGLMHDLGKAFMPLEVLNKPGKLTDAEFAIMKTHPEAGARALQEAGADAEAVDIALHHHEKINGRGYPYGLKGEEITLLARMGAVCDVYDAVTSVRAYKAPWDPSGALREMVRWDGHFDRKVFNAFVKTLGIYPVGSLVRMASDRLAVVVEPGTDSLLKPKVRAFYSTRSREKILPQVIDLAAPGCRDSIVSPESPEQWGLSNLEALWL